jgi:hypothetical protein
MAPIMGAVYRAVLGAADCSLHLVGHTGQGKSELSAKAQQHFGAGMDRLNLPSNWLSTGNALEGMAFLAKDAILVVDDFKPGGSKSETDRLHSLADRVLRAQGNNSGRARCRADGSVKAPRPPRGMILSSGEDIPRGESLRARLLVLHVAKGEVVLKGLAPYQQDGSQGLYAQAMAAYLQWLAPRYADLRDQLGTERTALRDKAAGSEGHARTPGIVTDLALGWKYFFAFAVDSGAITSEERNELTRKIWKWLLKAAADQEAEIAAQDSASRFVELLASTIASGRAYLTNRDGYEPPEKASWGWRSEDVGVGGNSDIRWRPQGKHVGWVDGPDLYLDPEASYAEVQRFGDEQGERLPISQRQLHKRLNERGLLASSEAGKLTTRRALQGRERAVLHLHTASLVPQKAGEPGESGAASTKPVENPPISSPDSVNGHGKPGDRIGGFDRENQGLSPVPPIPPISGDREARGLSETAVAHLDSLAASYRPRRDPNQPDDEGEILPLNAEDAAILRDINRRGL